LLTGGSVSCGNQDLYISPYREDYDPCTRLIATLWSQTLISEKPRRMEGWKHSKEAVQFARLQWQGVQMRMEA
jgi:hypothetical protein